MRGGLNADLAGWTAQNAGEAKRLGASVARVPIGYNRPEDPLVSEGMRMIRGARLRPLICIWFHSDEPPTVNDYAAYCARFAARWPQAMLELLNEPNHELFGNLEPDEAIAYVCAGAETIRFVNPEQKLLGPALTPRPGWARYFEAVYRELPGNLKIEPALHIYPRQQQPLKAITDAVILARRYGTVHVSEMGFVKEAYGPERQAELTEAALKRLRELGVATAVVHKLVAGEGNGWEQAADLSVIDQPRMRKAFREGLA